MAKATTPAAKAVYKIAAHVSEWRCGLLDDEEVLTDILTDARHAAERYGIDWDTLISRSYRHWVAESHVQSR